MNEDDDLIMPGFTRTEGELAAELARVGWHQLADFLHAINQSAEHSIRLWLEDGAPTGEQFDERYPREFLSDRYGGY